MFQYNFIIKKDRRVRALLRISLKDFKKLLPSFESAYENYKENYRKYVRVREIGGGRKSKLIGKPYKLLFITLFFIRVYPTFDLLEGIYCLDKSNLHHCVKLGMNLLEEVVEEKIPLPAKKTITIEELFKIVP